MSLTRNTPLVRGPCTLKRSPLAKVSKSQAAKKRQQFKAYDAMAESTPHYCFTCGGNGPLNHSHILTQGRHDHLKNHPLNILYECQFTCHTLYEHDKRKYALTYPDKWAEKLRRMQLLDSNAYAFFLMKNPWARPIR